VADTGFAGPTAYAVSGGPLYEKRLQNYAYRIRYKSEYLFRAPPRTLEGSHASEVP